MPFGDFKKIDTRPKVTEGESSNKDRDAFVEQIAKEKIEVEKKKREEIKLKKREERKMNESANNNGDIKEYIEDGGKPIRNISDEDDDDEEDEDDDVESDEDDLNPSKLSEYDDDKVDKESMLSNMTRESSQLSLGNSSSLEKKSNKTNSTKYSK